MSYEVIEASVHDGDIVELYEFALDQTKWYMTSNALDYEYGGNLYEAYPLERSKVERTGEMNRVKTTIMCDSENPIVKQFIVVQPRSQISVKIYAGHRGDDDFRLQFSGRVLNCKWSGGRDAELTCEPEMTSWRRQSLKFNYGKNCPYVVYSALCRKPREPIQGTVRYVSGLDIYIEPSLPITTPRMIGGVITWGTNSRTPTTHDVGVYLGYNVIMMRLTAAFVGIAAGEKVSMVIGCDHSTTACKDWHDNIDNFGGEPYIPEENPFEGRIV